MTLPKMAASGATFAAIAAFALYAKPLLAFNFEVENHRGGDSPAIGRPSQYDYAPTVIQDGKYRMWWCSWVSGAPDVNHGGDGIYYSEAEDINGPWSEPELVFKPRFGEQNAFDSWHTCDPSVVRVKSRYYMYYGGYPINPSSHRTRIGLATSSDGRAWTRANNGNPIISNARATVSGDYGAGQPSIIYLDKKFYITYTDDTGLAHDGAAQYVLRSSDATFQEGVEVLTSNGFEPRTSINQTEHYFIRAATVDWQYSDVLDAFIVGLAGVPGKLVYKVFTKDLDYEIIPQISISGSWSEGFGLVSRPDKHSIPTSTCGVVPLDIMRSVGEGPRSWDLAHQGFDIVTDLSCAESSMARAMDGYYMISPGLPQSLVIDGVRLQFGHGETLRHFSRNSIPVASGIYHSIPSGGSLFRFNPVVQSPERPGAFEVGGNLWPVSCPMALTTNGSVRTWITNAQWDSRQLMPSLHCLY